MPPKILKSAAEIVKDAIKTVEAEKRASEALGKVEGKTLMVTESDRTKVGQGYLGGPGFSSLQLTDPAYRDVGAVWGVAAPGKATTILNASRRVPEGEHVFTTMVGSPTQHRSNQQVFNKLLDEFRASAREGNLSDELRGRINDSLRSAINKEGNPIFAPNVDIMSPKFRKQANTFERRAVAADLIAGEGIGGKKGQIIDFDKVMRRTTDPMLLDVPTGSMGPRLFTLSGETIQRPDLHPAFPSILTGEDLGVAFQPAPIELMFRDYVKNLMETKGRKPGYMDITRGHGPKQFISEDLLTEMQKAGYAKGGSIDLEAEYRMGKGGLLKKAVKAVKDAIQPTAPQDEALRIAQKNAAKPVSEGGLGLPPDNTPMDRARAMGFDTPAYHARQEDYQSIDLDRAGQLSGGKVRAFFAADGTDVANAYAPNKLVPKKEYANVNRRSGRYKKAIKGKYDEFASQGDLFVKKPPYRDFSGLEYALRYDKQLKDLFEANINNPEFITNFMRNEQLIKLLDDDIDLINPKMHVEQAVEGSNVMPLLIRTKNFDEFDAGSQAWGTDLDARVLAGLRESGRKDVSDGVSIRNVYDGPVGVKGTTQMIFNPSAVRSRFAAFDPARIDENDLLAGFAALGITAPMLTSEEPEYRNGGAVMMAGGGDPEGELKRLTPFYGAKPAPVDTEEEDAKRRLRELEGRVLKRDYIEPQKDDLESMVRRGLRSGLGKVMSPEGSKRSADILTDVASFVAPPMWGYESGQALGRGYTAARRGDYGEAALEGGLGVLGVLPAVPGVVQGAKAAGRAAKKAAPAVREAVRDALESAMESGAILDPRMQAIAYHGTPHKFEKFDASKIGTGEGAQAYGHGIYFAESPEVAKGYQKELATEVTIDDKPYFTKGKKVSSTGDQTVDDFLTWHLGDVGKAIEAAKRMGFDEYIPKLEALKDRVKKIQGGHLYTVDIPDESIARMLDWDKPLEQQSAIRDLLKGTDYEVGLSAKEAEKIADERLRQEAYDWADETGGDPVDYMNNANWEKYVDDVMRESGKVHGSTTGEELHKMIMRDQGYRKELFDPYNYQVDTSETLRELGIPGIKYLDRASRSAGEGTRNFVVFPGEEETVKILERKKRGGAVVMKSGGKVKSAADMFHAKGHQALMDFDNKTKKRKG